MTLRLLRTSLLLALATLFVVGQSLAQNHRPEKTVYIMPRVGLSNYLGDFDTKPFGFEEWKVDGKIPYSASLEIGYQFTPSFAFALGYNISEYPVLEGQPGVALGNAQNYMGDYSRRHIAMALFRLTGKSRIAPYIELGGGGVAGLSDPQGDEVYAFGPIAGLGLDIVLNDRTSLIFGGQGMLTFPDEKVDAAGNNGYIGGNPNRWGEFDFLGNVSLGLKINFRSAFTPVDVLAINGPSALQTNQSGTFEATVNMDATEPVEYRWDFGDGGMATGLVANHAYSRAGTYTVTFTASNSGSTDSESMSVTVTDPPVAAAIVSINASPNPATVGETVRFSSTVRGDAPITYSWNFGDGSTGTGANPTHAYAAPGTYNVTLTVQNNVGSDSRSLQVTVNPARNACDDITELNSVYFGRNSSTLTDEAKAALMENIEVLRDCPDLRVRIEGFAAPGERNPQRLSEDRARAVMQFYTENGIPAANLMMEGRGQVGGTTSKKDDTSQFRRVDSIPVR